jgi:hypothetical protein
MGVIVVCRQRCCFVQGPVHGAPAVDYTTLLHKIDEIARQKQLH